MSFLVSTIIICVVVVVVGGAAIVTCALGWNRIMGCIFPDRLRKPYPTEQTWFNDSRNNIPTPDPEKTEFKGEPVTSPETSPVASPVGSPRTSRYDPEDTVKSSKASRCSTDEAMTRSSMKEMKRCSTKDMV